MTDTFTTEDRVKLNEIYEFFQTLKKEREERMKLYSRGAFSRSLEPEERIKLYGYDAFSCPATGDSVPVAQA